jgi:hypothetical protein
VTLLSQGISNVRAFMIPAGIRDDGTVTENVSSVLVKWRSSWLDKMHQIYVNGRLAAVTIDCEQRKITAPVPSSEQTAVRIEVFATETENAHIDQGYDLTFPSTQQGRIQIDFAKTHNLPRCATVDYYYDNGSGNIDYDNPFNILPIPIWPGQQDNTGFGLSSFGNSDFGFDGSASVGFGKGDFGFGQFGFDACLMNWQSSQLTAGKYKFGIKVTDSFGNIDSASAETEQLTIIPPVKPAAKLSIYGFDKSINQLILKID